MIELSIGSKIPTKEDMLNFLSFAEIAPHLAVDTEKDPVTKLFLGTSLAFPGDGMYFPIGHLEAETNIDSETYDGLFDVIKSTKLRVFHNAAHDLQVIKDDVGLDLVGPFADTMIMAHMIDENVLSKALDYLHKYYTGGEGKARPQLMQDFIDNMGWQYVPVQLMYGYGTQDAIATSELFVVLEPLFVEQFGELFNAS